VKRESFASELANVVLPLPAAGGLQRALKPISDA